jgi:hypothetical protein
MSDAKEKTKGERRYKELAKAKQELVLSLSFNFFFSFICMQLATRTGLFSPLDQVRITLEGRFLAGL